MNKFLLLNELKSIENARSVRRKMNRKKAWINLKHLDFVTIAFIDEFRWENRDTADRYFRAFFSRQRKETHTQTMLQWIRHKPKHLWSIDENLNTKWLQSRWNTLTTNYWHINLSVPNKESALFYGDNSLVQQQVHMFLPRKKESFIHIISLIVVHHSIILHTLLARSIVFLFASTVAFDMHFQQFNTMRCCTREKNKHKQNQIKTDQQFQGYGLYSHWHHFHIQFNAWYIAYI